MKSNIYPTPCYVSLRIAFCIGFLLSGCTTLVSSEKFSPSSEGIPYCLPIQALTYQKVTEDGPLEFKVLEDIPDESNLYVLRAKTFLTSYTLDIQKDKPKDPNTGGVGSGSCLLSHVSLKNSIPETLVTALNEAVGEVGKQVLDKIEQKESDAQKKVEEKIALLKTVETKKFEYCEAKRDWDLAPTEKKVTKKEALDTAEKELRKARFEAGIKPLGELPNCEQEDFIAQSDKLIFHFTPAFYTIKQEIKNGEPTVSLIGMNYSQTVKDKLSTGREIKYPPE